MTTKLERGGGKDLSGRTTSGGTFFAAFLTCVPEFLVTIRIKMLFLILTTTVFNPTLYL